MARKRYQNGRVFLKGKKEEKWVGRYREDVVEITGTTRRVRRSVIVGTKRELPTKRLAERRLATILARINCLDYRPGRAATFEEFIERLGPIRECSKAQDALNIRGNIVPLEAIP